MLTLPTVLYVVTKPTRRKNDNNSDINNSHSRSALTLLLQYTVVDRRAHINQLTLAKKPHSLPAGAERRSTVKTYL